MLELNHGFRIVDCHARIDAGGPGSTVDASGLERELHQAGIVRAVVFPSADPSSGERSYVRANNAIARQAVDRPFVSFARISGPRDPGNGAGSRLRNLAARPADWHTTPPDVEQYAYDDRFHGFRLHPVHDGLPTESVLDELGAVGLPVLTYGGEGFPPASVAETLLGRGFPVVLDHFGGYPLDRERMHRAVDLLDDHDDLYLGTSAVRYRELLERSLREHPDRVVFGSGAPVVHPNVAVMELLTLDVPGDAMQRAFSRNAVRLAPALGAED